MLKGFGEIPDRENYTVISPSKLACLRESPKLYKRRYIDKIDDTTKSMEFGTMVHMAILEPVRFMREYRTLPKVTETNDLSQNQLKEMCRSLELPVSGKKSELIERIRTKVYLEPQLDEMTKELEGQNLQIISHDQYFDVMNIVEEINNDPKIGNWLKIAEKEQKGYIQDPQTGLVMSFMSDAFLSVGNVDIIIDFKVTTHWNEFQFESNLFNNSFHLLAAAYSWALSEINNRDYSHFVFVAIEPKPPYRIRKYNIDFGCLEAGKSELRFYLDEMSRRLKTNDWTEDKSETDIKTVTLKPFQWEKVKGDANGTTGIIDTTF
ncbi:MAG TPA: hypothetical protein DCE71_07850 [Parachlamydiales bacterium]|nr:hypothetical protein [Parachlamydiales bacterium]